jgi:hypothetical protein
MTTTPRTRRCPRITLIAAPLAVLALTTTACASSRAAEPARAVPAHAVDVMHTMSGARAAKAALHDAMRKLWEEHVAWTRLAIVAFADGSPDFDATAARLMQNQVDIGNAIKPYFGDAAGDALAALLHDHIAIAVDILTAAKAGDTAAFDSAKTRWYANADQIADFLANANPKNWPDAAMRQMMRVHLDQTLVEASDELTGQYAAGVAEYDEIEQHMLDMADMLTDGIVAAFPQKFH